MPGISRLVLVTALFGCAGSTAPAPDLDLHQLPATLSFRVGEERRIGSAVVRFAEVGPDSRCPTDVVCVWAGNAELTFAVGPAVGEGPTYRVPLNTTLEPRSGTALGLTLTIVRLLPEPISSKPTRDYQAEVRVERAR